MYKKFDKPIRTEVYKIIGYEIESEISILGETEKAYLICYNKPIKRGSGISTYNDTTQWIAKIIWDNDEYFTENHKGERIFNEPYWMQ